MQEIDQLNSSDDIEKDLLELQQEKELKFEKQNDSNKIFGSLLGSYEGEENNSNILFYSNRKQEAEKTGK